MSVVNAVRRNWLQILSICGAFLVVGVITAMQISSIMRVQIMGSAEGLLRTSEANMKAALTEPDLVLGGVVLALQEILAVSEDPNAAVERYLVDMTNWMNAEGEQVTGFSGLYGVFGGSYIDASGWEPPEGYVPESRLWYAAAKEGQGAVVMTDPYTDMDTGELVVSIAAELYDNTGGYGVGQSVGIVALDVSIARLAQQVAEMSLTEGGFGTLIDRNGFVMSHNDDTLVGVEYATVYPEFRKLKKELDNGADAAGATYEARGGGGMRLCVFRKTYNGWYIGAITPEARYFENMYRTIRLISALFVGLALALCYLIIRMNGRQHNAVEEKNAAVLANESKSKFLATMSHEIRTPMNAIIGIAQMQMQSGDAPHEQMDAWEKVYTSGYGLLGIINDVLDLSKIETGKLELLPTEYDTPSLINDAVQLNVVRIHGKPIRFELNLDAALPARLLGDELRVKQVLNNVLSNAFKYTSKGKVALTVSHENAHDKVALIFKVSDTGQGMQPEQLKRLFDEYSRFNAEANRNTEGTGLGMSITRRLVELMDGKITVESEYGVGTTFTIRLLQQPVNGGVIGAELAEKLRSFTFSAGGARLKVSYTQMPYGRVLIVDDVETNLFVAEGLMVPYGLTIKTATSGFEAVELIASKRRYDIIFLDHMMPGMDGMEACAKIRAMGYQGAIVALTANAIVGNDRLFLENGFNAFISKPIDVRVLDVVLHQYVRGGHKGAAVFDTKNKAPLPAPDADTRARLMEAFRRDARKAVAALKETAEAGDAKLFTTTAHAMKSALSNIGETARSEAAQRLEAAGKKGDWAYIRAHAGALVAALEELLKEEGGEQAEESAAEDLAALAEKLKIISDACEDYDDGEAAETLNALLAMDWARGTKATLEEIRSALFSDSDFERAKAIADAMIAAIDNQLPGGLA